MLCYILEHCLQVPVRIGVSTWRATADFIIVGTGTEPVLESKGLCTHTVVYNYFGSRDSCTRAFAHVITVRCICTHADCCELLLAAAFDCLA